MTKVLRDATRKAVADPDFKNMMAKLNSPIQYLDAPEFEKYWKDDAKRLALRLRAAAHGRDMLWPAVARRYVESFERARVQHAARLRTVFQANTLSRERPALRLPRSAGNGHRS